MNIFALFIWGLIVGTILFKIFGYIGSKMSFGDKTMALIKYLKGYRKYYVFFLHYDINLTKGYVQL